MRPFVSLHTHSEFSDLDGVGRVDAVVARAKALGMPALALTEHGTMRGIFSLHEAAAKHQIQPIYGMEAYVCDDRRRQGLTRDEEDELVRGITGARARREAVYEAERDRGLRDRFHLTLLAQSQEGFANLMRLSSIGWTEGFWKRPRIDWEALEEHREGLIVLTGCQAGPIGTWVLRNAHERALERMEWLVDRFAGALYAEIMPNSREEQRRVNASVALLAEHFGIPLVATCDAHYLYPDDWEAHDVKLCVSTGVHVQDTDRLRFECHDYWLHGGEDMERAFAERHGYLGEAKVRAAIDATLEIAERCQAKIVVDRFRALLPDFPLPVDCSDEDDLLVRLCTEGWNVRDMNARLERAAVRTGRPLTDLTEEYTRRVNRELRTIREMKIARYFLIVWDLIRWARTQGIGVGPGRGSSAGSIVAYLLEITALDPIEHGLLFERFIAPGRVDLPDVDMDFEDRRRDELLGYLRERYGEDRVAQIATLGVFRGRACLRDVARAFNISLSEVDRTAKSLIERAQGEEGQDRILSDSLREVPDVIAFGKKYPQVMTAACAIEGQFRVVGRHAAGVVVSPVPLRDVVPIELVRPGTADEATITALDMRGCEAVGLVKMDLLGLRTLAVVMDTLRAMRERHSVEMDLRSLAALDLNEPDVLARFTAHDFFGVFQFDTPSALKVCAGLDFKRFADVSAAVAVNRPATTRSGMAEEYVLRTRDPSRWERVHPIVDEVLADTFGIIVYQEQIIRLFRDVGGYDPEAADKVRKAVAKKYGPEALEKERGKFVAGALERGVDESAAHRIVDLVKDAGFYSFNLAHSAAYAMIAYWCQWLKVRYPAEFVWALLCNEPDRAERARFVREARRLGIDVRPPDVNVSGPGFTLHRETDEEFPEGRDVIVTGLTAIKGVGAGAVEELCKAARPFKSFADFHARIDRRRCNRRVVEALARAGALRSMVPNQRWIVEHTTDVWESLQRGKRIQADELIARSATEPDYDAPARARVVGEVCPIAIGQSPVGAFSELWDVLGVTWTGLEDETLWEKHSVYVRGQVVQILAWNEGKGAERGQTFDVIIEDEHGSARFKLGPELVGLWRDAVYQGSMLMMLAIVDGDRQFLRPAAIASADRCLEKLRAGERFDQWEAVFSRQHHPLRPYSRRNLDAADDWLQPGTPVHAMIGPVHQITDRGGREMAFVSLIGWEGARKGVAFSSAFDLLRSWLVPGKVVRLVSDPPRRRGDALVLTGRAFEPMPMKASTPSIFDLTAAPNGNG